MRHNWLVLLMAVFFVGCNKYSEKPGKYNINPVPFTAVKVVDNFWAKRIQINTDVTIPIAFNHCEITGRIDNFKVAGGVLDGDFRSTSPFDDSDVFKVIEGAAYALQMNPNKELELYTDSIIDFIAMSQEDDGYLYTYRTIMGDDSHPWIGSKRWEYTHILSHELYNVGHMYEAAVAYYLATGKRKLLDVAIKNADLIAKDFGWDAFQSYPGHQEIEIGLVKLYNVTGDSKYLELAKFFLDIRGNVDRDKKTYDQSHLPVIEQDEAVGHSVRAAYMYTAMADIAALTGNQDYVKAIKKLWKDIVYTKLYITGGIGSAGGHEGFGVKYELPNPAAYCETCAAVANVFWNHRLFLMEGDAKYIDVLERSLYNNVLSGVSISGDHFFYPNPLESYFGHERQEWFGCACCPSNICRFMPSMPGYIYASKDKEVYVNLYIASEANFELGNNKVYVIQHSDMPWEGHSEIVVNQDLDETITLKLRVPGWARNEAVPGGELYWFKNVSNKMVGVKVNGESVDYTIDKKGYINISRKWSGDKVEVELPLEVRKVACNPQVDGNVDKIALQRGPIMYCSEGLDFESGQVANIVLKENTSLTCQFEEDLIGGVVTINGIAIEGQRLNSERTEFNKVEFKAIPYYAWCHRGTTPMVVWYATNENASRPKPAPTIANASEISGSVMNIAIESVRDQILPSGSNDKNTPKFHWWPHENQNEWITYTFKEPQKISGTKVFWFDDNGGCRPPESWKVYYLKDNEWVPFKNKYKYGVEINIINQVEFEPEKTTAVKLEVQLPKKSSSGLYEWIVE
ncbi:hypothetical protein SAMN05444274_11341 [Mariniphaga anaerophila]|uniref:F5/8 type C domain-containing protein n=1 Tax=Mariniphaga anaerophila TaxID=1484053 RepID=A0A1M5FME7_9BACT|nr:glycoside hydrolase family 127 protein [Mariniphaga anaerophila]SHF92594.1 hypothetical protein SAMN05444274_11341 [Mariniphaga anaerophila]